MRYEDRLPEEGINISERNPLKEFLRLSVWAIVAVVALGFLLSYAGGSLSGLVPFKYELSLAEKIDSTAKSNGWASPFEKTIVQPELQEYLQEVANEVTTAMGIDETMPITVHYSDDGLVNAYATIGGHVYFFKGLLRLLPHENALAMLMAHEFAHVTHRHPAKGIGGGLALVMGGAMLGLSSENYLFNFSNNLTSTRFSRKMETQADAAAVAAVNSMYGHVAGAGALFETFMQQKAQQQKLESTVASFESFLSTHPLDLERIERIQTLATENAWRTDGELTPLPVEYESWLK